jgi:hypothetical protein
MTNRLKVTDLDFDVIKNNLKEFLNQQTEFTDYDFEGSGLSILLDILAYNTHYNAYYLNMVANESFLDTALLRDSVVSHAKSLGYTPRSISSPRAYINFIVNSSDPTPSLLTLPRGYNFLSNLIDGKAYNFVVLEDTTVTKSNSQFFFENLELYEGQLTTFNFIQDEQVNPKQIFTIPETNIDTGTLRVSVRPSISNTTSFVYTLVDEILDLNSKSEVFFLQETRGGKYQIYFGNDFLGKKLPDGAVVTASYLVTNGSAANKANNYVATSTLTDTLNESLTNFNIISSSAASAGSDREGVDEVKSSAISQYSSQNRLVSKNDYSSFIKKKYPFINSISVWGGEDAEPKVFGKVFISIQPKENYFISENEKQNIIDEIIKPYSIVSITPEIVEPDYVFVLVSCDVKYNQSKTILTEEQLKLLIRNTILIYEQNNLNIFEGVLIKSKLQEDINRSDFSIIGNDLTISLQKRFLPKLNLATTYKINFNVPILKGSTILSKIKTTPFFANDRLGILRECFLEEVPNSFSGLTSIVLVDSGFGYTSEPIVTITGDGFGATAEAKIINGKVRSIEITNRGIGYTRALITISGGGGSGASALPNVDLNNGILRQVYFDQNTERKIINDNIGTIDYEKGIIIIKDLVVKSTNSTENFLKITVEPQFGFIQTVRNTIFTIDEFDSTTFDIQTKKE